MDRLYLQVAFIYNQRDQVLAVLNGSIDVALVNAEIPQQMGAEGLIDITQLKVLSPVSTQQHHQLCASRQRQCRPAQGHHSIPPITLGGVRQLGLSCAPGCGAAASCPGVPAAAATCQPARQAGWEPQRPLLSG